MRRGQILPLNLVILAMLVGLVLIMLILIFTSHASSFNDSIQKNRCDGPDCTITQNAGLMGVHVTHTTTVHVGEPVVFHVSDENARFSSVRLEVDGSPLTGRVIGTTPPADAQQSATSHRTEFDGTSDAGTYAYTLYGITASGEKVVIEHGTFVVSDQDHPTGSALARIEIPDHIASDGTIYARVDAPVVYAAGLLVFRNGKQSVAVDLSDASGSLAGSSDGPFITGSYELDVSSSWLRRPSGARLALDSGTTASFDVTDALSCTVSSDCSYRAPFCTDNGTALACSASCAAAGERAADVEACCGDLAFDDRSGTCVEQSKPLRIVLVPIGVDESRLSALETSFKADLERATPLRECSSSQVEFETADASCAASCPLASSDAPISEAAWNRCLDTILSCGTDTRVDADRIVGIVGADSIRVASSAGVSASAGRAELGGRRFALAAGTSDPDRVFLREFGFTYGLMPLACSDDGQLPAGTCTGPNRLDCSPDCTSSGDAACTADPGYSRAFVMSSCAGASSFGPAAYEILKSSPSFSRAMEGCR